MRDMGRNLNLWCVAAALMHFSAAAGAQDDPRRLFQPSIQQQQQQVAPKEYDGRVFAPMPEQRSPDHPSWNNSIAVCTMIQQEAPEDMLEWVMYHKWRGVDMISIVEDNFTVTAALEQALQPYIASGFVHLRAWGSDQRDQRGQMAALAECFRDVRLTHNWVAFFDADEYLMLLDRDKDLKGLLDEYKQHPALAVNWILFGSGERLRRPKHGGVLRWYMHCKRTASDRIKVIANSYYLLMMGPHAHNFFYRRGRKAVAEDFSPIAPPPGAPEQCDPPLEEALPGIPSCMQRPGMRSNLKDQRLKRVALFHYATKSREDFNFKRGRDFASGLRPRPAAFLASVDKVAAAAGGVCDEGIKVWDQCCSRGPGIN